MNCWDHSRRARKKRFFKLVSDFSSSWNIILFHSPQIHQNKQIGAIFQTTLLFFSRPLIFHSRSKFPTEFGNSIAKMNVIHILLSLATNFDWSLQQLDVKNAFLHGDLEEVYMETPSGLNGDFKGNDICRLRKALYGCKQSPWAWFRRFAKAMNDMKFWQSQGNHTLFIKHSHMGKLIAIIVYVDDKWK